MFGVRVRTYDFFGSTRAAGLAPKRLTTSVLGGVVAISLAILAPAPAAAQTCPAADP